MTPGLSPPFRNKARLRAAGVVLALLALLLRIAVPAGFMPVASGASGITITLCDGTAHGASITFAAKPGPAPAHHDADHVAPCPYAVLALALDRAKPAPLPSPAAPPAANPALPALAQAPPARAHRWLPPGRAPPLFG